MATPIKIKRRLTGAAGAPTDMTEGEIAVNFTENKLYVHNGTTAVPFGGKGEFVDLGSAQTLSGKKTFSGGLDAGAKILTNVADPVADTDAANKGFVASAITTATGGLGTMASQNADSVSITGGSVKATLDANSAVIANVATPVANTDAANKAFVTSAVAAVVDSAPAVLDTLKELSLALGDDPNFATTISASIGTKLSKTSNLSDLDSASTARTNLGLGTMATQNANLVAITGGTIDNVVIDGGVY